MHMATRKNVIALAKAAKIAARQRDNERKNKLISQVEQRPAIWNKFLRDHCDKQLIESLWKEIAKLQLIPVHECRKRWKNLRDHFSTLHHEIKGKKGGTELTEDDIKTVKWVFYRKLIFLKDVIKQRETSGNLDDAYMDNSSDMQPLPDDGDDPTPNELFVKLSREIPQTDEICDSQDDIVATQPTQDALASTKKIEICDSQDDMVATQPTEDTLAGTKKIELPRPSTSCDWKANSRKRPYITTNPTQNETTHHLQQTDNELARFSSSSSSTSEKFGSLVGSLLNDIADKKRRREAEKSILDILYNALDE